MKFFRGYIETALDLVGVRSGDDIVDIACGPGTLTLAAADKVATVKALDFSGNMISELRKGIALRGATNIEARQGDGQDLPYADGSFDAAFSMFGLMFFPDRVQGLGEIYRTLKPGGRACVSSWAPVADSPMMRTMFDALRAIKPDMPAPMTDLESLENPDVLESELRAAGFRDTKVKRVTQSLQVESAEAYWDGTVRGSAPVLMMKQSMPETVWAEKSEIAIEFVEKAIGSFPASLSSDAWLGIGTK
jgi:SAM-dependent methyltransferase